MPLLDASCRQELSDRRERREGIVLGDEAANHPLMRGSRIVHRSRSKRAKRASDGIVLGAEDRKLAQG